MTTANKISYVMLANMLSSDSMALRIYASGRSITGTTNLELDFGATQVISTAVQNNDLFALEGVVRRTGATSQVAEAECVPQLSTHNTQSASPAENAVKRRDDHLVDDRGGDLHGGSFPGRSHSWGCQHD